MKRFIAFFAKTLLVDGIKAVVAFLAFQFEIFFEMDLAIWDFRITQIVSFAQNVVFLTYNARFRPRVEIITILYRNRPRGAK